MNRYRFMPSILFILAVLTISGVASSQQAYFEDFTSTTYKDEINTTADWDVSAGELKLPSLPAYVGGIDTPGSAGRVVVAGNLAFVADYDGGLQVIDISDPASPVFVDSWAFQDYAKDVVVAGDLAFLAYNGYGLVIIDISNPANLSSVGIYDTPYQASGVAVSGNTAFVADVAGGLQIIDISNPSNPGFVSSIDTPGYPTTVEVVGDFAYVGDGINLRVIDITDISSPLLVGSCETPGGTSDVAIAGNLAFVSGSSSGLQVVDISDPASPVLIGGYDTPGIAYGVTVSGDLAFVADNLDGIQVIDISDPTNPVLVGNYDSPSYSRDVAVDGALAFVADASGGLLILEVRRSTTPVLVASYDTPGIPMEIALDGDHAFVAGNQNGLQVFDISDPASPVLVGNATPQSTTRSVAIAGDYAFTAEGFAGLQVLDISDPLNPTFAGDFNLPGYAHDLAVAGNHVILANDAGGLDVIDISDPTLTQFVINYDTPGAALYIEIAGDHAYVADGPAGLHVVDISDPANPVFTGSYATPDQAQGLAIAGDLAFVAAYHSGLQIIDISDPANPTFTGSYDTPGYAEDVAIAGDLAFVTDWTAGLLVIDISDPANPALVDLFDTATTAWAVAVAGDYAFVTDEMWGLHVVQVYEHLALPDRAVGQSLAVDGAADAIPRAQLLSTETAVVSWELSSNAGVSWTTFTPDGTWARIALPGDDLIWRTTHTIGGEWNPTVYDLTLEWLNEFAPISSIDDLPGDQGGWVNLSYTRSGYDFADEVDLPLTGYGIYRRVDSMPLRMRILDEPAALPEAGSSLSSFASQRIRRLDDRFYVLGEGTGDRTDRGELPPGVWEFISFYGALQQDGYLEPVPTLADSTVNGGIQWSVFLTTTHTTTPSIWFASHPDSGYSVDNLAPAEPAGFMVDYDYVNGASLTWDECPEEDFLSFRVYRGDSEDFEIGPGTLIHETGETAWIDAGGQVSHFYKLTALDQAGNESDPASPEEVTASDTAAPRLFALHQNSPNPFNPCTTISFDLPSAGEVHLEVFDVTGRLVATLLDGPCEAGRQAAIWRGRSDDGHQAGSGMYFYRLSAAAFSETRKMLLLK